MPTSRSLATVLTQLEELQTELLNISKRAESLYLDAGKIRRDLANALRADLKNAR